MHPDDLAEDLLHAAFRADPISASLLGLPGHDEALPDLSAAGEEALAGRYLEIAARAAALQPEGLAETVRQTLDFVRHTAATSAETTALGTVEFTVTDFQVAPAAMLLAYLPLLPLTDDERVRAYGRRLAAVPGFLRTAAARHRQGVARGRPPVGRLVRGAISQLDRVLGDDSLGGIARSGAEDIARETVRPAFAEYREALRELAEAGRDDDHPGLAHLPDGRSTYAVLVREHSSSEHSPEELHELGLRITRELTGEYAGVGRRVFGTADRGEIFERLRHDPELRYSSAEEMLAQARAAVRRAEAAAPAWFATVPEAPCLVEPVPPSQEAGGAPAYYVPGALDGSRSGTYFLNTASPGERLRHTAEAYAFHEAVPGHHFQLTLAQQVPGLPLARRVLGDTAATEGWGLYAERLADEMGLYSDDLARLGMLTADSWRAGRLVVDTGLHALGWTRARAVQWLRENTPMGQVDIESEVDRYIAMPGQALAYMVGRLRLQEMRASAARRLGAGFELRLFHDVVLHAGSLPLPALEDAVARWAARARPAGGVPAGGVPEGGVPEGGAPAGGAPAAR